MIIRSRIVFALLVPVLLTAFAACTKDGAPTTPTPPATKSITTGLMGDVVSQSISSTGGVVAVSKAGDVLDGLSITVPANAFAGTRMFTIREAAIQSHTFGDDFHPITPVIRVENGGGYVDSIMTMRIPVAIANGDFAMAFAYDATLGTLEGLPLFDEDATGITIGTRHFSQQTGNGGSPVHVRATGANYMDIIVSTVSEVRLLNAGTISTGFKAGIDDWEFGNEGTFLSPDGHCAGMSITMMWYYLEHGRLGQKHLNGLFSPVPNMDYDNALGERFASTIQCDLDWDNKWRSLFLFMERFAPSLQWKAFAASMLVTREPQYVGLHHSNADGGHAIVATSVAYGSGTLGVVDPNFHGQEHEITWGGTGFSPYVSGDKVTKIGTVYDQIGYLAKSALIDWNTVGTRWAQVRDSTIGNDKFPVVSFTYFDPVTKASNPVTDTITVQGDTLAFRSIPTQYTVVEYGMSGSPIFHESMQRITVGAGISRFCLVMKGNTQVNCAGKPVVEKGMFITSRVVTIKSLLSPVIESIEPGTASRGQSVTIKGKLFGDGQGSSSLVIGDIEVTDITEWTDVSIKFNVPQTAMSGNVVVTVGGAASNGMYLVVITGDGIASIVPDSGYTGMRVVINGAGFGNAQPSGHPVIFVGGVTGGAMASDTIISWSDNKVVATVPIGIVYPYSPPETLKVHLALAGGDTTNSVSFKIYNRVPPDLRYGAGGIVVENMLGGSYASNFDISGDVLPGFPEWPNMTITRNEYVPVLGNFRFTASGTDTWKDENGYGAQCTHVYSIDGNVDTNARTLSSSVTEEGHRILNDTSYLNYTVSYTLVDLPLESGCDTCAGIGFGTDSYAVSPPAKYSHCVKDLVFNGDYRNYQYGGGMPRPMTGSFRLKSGVPPSKYSKATVSFMNN
jgi:hypothetical protein